MQESLVFLILGVGRLREDQLICVETRENLFFIIWDLYVYKSQWPFSLNTTLSLGSSDVALLCSRSY